MVLTKTVMKALATVDISQEDIRVYKGKYIPYGPVHMGAKFSQLVAAFQIADTEEARKQLATELVVYLGFYLMDDEPKTPVY